MRQKKILPCDKKPYYLSNQVLPCSKKPYYLIHQACEFTFCCVYNKVIRLSRSLVVFFTKVIRFFPAVVCVPTDNLMLNCQKKLVAFEDTGNGEGGIIANS